MNTEYKTTHQLVSPEFLAESGMDVESLLYGTPEVNVADMISKLFYAFPGVKCVVRHKLNKSVHKPKRWTWKGLSAANLIKFLESGEWYLAISPASIGCYVMDRDHPNCKYDGSGCLFSYKSGGDNDGMHFWFFGSHRARKNINFNCGTKHAAKHKDKECGDVRGKTARPPYVNSLAYIRDLRVIELIINKVPGSWVALEAGAAREPGMCVSSYDRTHNLSFSNPPSLGYPGKSSGSQSTRKRPYRGYSEGELIEEAVGIVEGTRTNTIFDLLSEWCYQRDELIKDGTIKTAEIHEFKDKLINAITCPMEPGNYIDADNSVKSIYKFTKNVFKVEKPQPVMWDEYAELYKQGKTFSEIGRLYEVHHTTISRAMIKMGLYDPKTKTRTF